jgi:tetratricopeptide (TPR) repeat protein
LIHAEPPPKGVWTAYARCLLMRNLQRTREQADWDEVDRAVSRAEKHDGDTVDLALTRAERLATTQNLDGAAALLAQRRAQHPDQVRPWVAEAELAERRKVPVDALRLLEEAERKLGDRPEIRVARAHFWGRHPGKDVEPALRRLEQGVGEMSTHDRAHLLGELAMVWYQAGDAREAERLWREQARLQPHTLRPRLFLLDLALQGGGEVAVIPLVRELRLLEGEDGVLWRYGEAARLVLRAKTKERSALAEARRACDELAKRSEDAPQVALLAAELDELEGQPGKAIAHYQSAVDHGERRPAAVRRLAGLLVERRRFAEADRALRRLEEQGPLSKDMARLGADVALRLREFPRAVALARQAVPRETRDYRDSIWLGRVLASAGQTQEAEEVLRRCAGKSAGIAEPWIALAEVLARDGQWQRAEEVVAQVNKAVVPERRPAALARVYEAIDRGDLASRQYEEATRSSLDNFLLLRQAAAFHLRLDQPRQAEAYLRRLLDPNVDAPEECTAWARRQLAFLLAVETGTPRHNEALALIDLNLRERPNSQADVRARALVQASRPDQYREGLRRFEAALKDLPASPEELLVLANLHEAAGERGPAREQTMSLLALDGRNPQYLAQHVRCLLGDGRVDEAEIYLSQLERLQPRAPRTKGLGARLRWAKAPSDVP